MGSRKQRERRNALKSILHAGTPEGNSDELLLSEGGSFEILHAGSDGSKATRFQNQVVYTGGLMHPQLRLESGYQGPSVVLCDGILIDDETPLNRDHNPERPVGHCPDVHSDGEQLLASGEFSVDSEDTREITRSKKFPWKTSIGLILLEWKMIREGETLRANGRNFDGPLLFVTRSKLKHIAILSEPGDQNVPRLMLATLSQGKAVMSFEEWVAGLGLDMATLPEDTVARLRSEFESRNQGTAEANDNSEENLEGEDSQEDDEQLDAEDAEEEQAAQSSAHARNASQRTLHASRNSQRTANRNDRRTARQRIRDAYAEEEARATGLRTLCARFGNPTVSIGGTNVNLAAHAIRCGWTSERTELEARRHQELEAMRQSRNAGPGIHSTSRSQRGSLQTLQASLLLRANIALDCRSFDNPAVRSRLPEWLRAGVNDSARQRVMDQAHEFRDISMLEATGMALATLGHDVPRNRIDMLHAAFSTGAVTQLFGATLGAQVLAAYAEIEDFSNGWVSERENPDMESHARIRMEAAGDLSHHPAGGAADHATRAAKSESTKVDRFSRQMNIDEADFMSDNFAKLADTPREFGLAGGRVRPNLVAAVLLANANLNTTGRALFNTTDGSDLGSGKALERATLSEAIAKLGLRRDGDASLNLRPTHLLVGPALRDLAVQLTKSDMVMVDAGRGSKNVLAEYNIKPVSEARLQNGLVDPVSKAALAGSSTNWTLVSAEAHTIEVTYLEGAGRVPIVKTEPLIGGEFGMNITVRHYVGCKALDFRGFVRGQG